MGLSFGVSLSAKAVIITLPLLDCGIKPINLSLTTGTVTDPDTNVGTSGSPYVASTGAVTLTGLADTPAPACTGLLGSVVQGQLGSLASLGRAALTLKGKITTAAPAAPPAVTVPPAVSVPAKAKVAVQGSKTVTVSGTTVSVKVLCQNQDCKGGILLTAATASTKAKAAKAQKLGSSSYTAKAGKTKTVKVALTKSARAYLKKHRRTRAQITVSVSGGTGSNRTVTLTTRR